MVTLKQSLQEEIPFKKFGRVYTSKKKKKNAKKLTRTCIHVQTSRGISHQTLILVDIECVDYVTMVVRWCSVVHRL